ncbi:recombinase family protein [Motilibacter sp. K478]|nr:recombinase family protein [Motilibacter aurantiacus]
MRPVRARPYAPFTRLTDAAAPGTQGIYLYLRLSKRHGDRGDAIERQRVDLRRMLDQQSGWTVLGEFIDNDSASRFAARERAGFEAMNVAIKDGTVPALAFAQLDRVERRGSPATMLWLAMCKEHEVELLSLGDNNEELRMLTAAAKVLVSFRSIMAEEETDIMSKRQRIAKRHAAESGFHHGGQLPFGWTIGPRELDEHNRHGTRLVPHPIEHPALKDAVRLALQGASMATIARYWADELGIVAHDGKPVYQASVLRALRSPRLVGYRMRQVPEHKRGQRIDLMQFVARDASGTPVIAHEPVCDLTTWMRLQRVITERSSSGARKPWGSHEWLLSGLLRCGACGGRLYGAQKMQRDGSKTFVYRCHANRVRGKGTCVGCSVVGPGVERFVLGWLVEYLSDDRLAPAAAEHEARQEREPSKEERELEEAREEQTLLLVQQKAGAWRGALLATLLQMLEEVQARIDDLEQRVLEQTRLPLPVQTRQELRDTWPAMDLEQRRHLLRLVIEGIHVEPSRRSGKGMDERVRISPRL